MAIHVEHELHARRRGRNLGVFTLLGAFVVLVFVLTMVKVVQLGDARKFEATDHVVQPQLLPDATAAATTAAPATTATTEAGQ